MLLKCKNFSENYLKEGVTVQRINSLNTLPIRLFQVAIQEHPSMALHTIGKLSCLSTFDVWSIPTSKLVRRVVLQMQALEGLNGPLGP